MNTAIAVCFTCMSIGDDDSFRRNVETWIKDLQCDDVNARRGAAFAINFMKPPEAIPALLKALNDPDVEVRRTAAAAFNAHSKNASLAFRDASKPAVPLLGGLLSDKEAGVRRTAAATLLSLAPLSKESLPALKKAMDDGDKVVCINAMAAVAILSTGEDSDKALRSLLKFSTDKDASVHRASTGVFCDIGARAVPILKDGLKDRDARIRGWTIGAIIAISKKGVERAKIPADVIHLLTDLINDKDGEVVTSAMYAVSRFGERAKEAVPVMVKRLKDPDWQIRCYAIARIEEFGIFAAPAIPALKDALTDENDSVRLSSKRALEAIEEAKNAKAEQKKVIP
jgi:HEAT repeat protein